MYHYYEHPNPEPCSPSPSPPSPSSSTSCSQGHRSSLILSTEEGGRICLLCFSNLISNPNSPSFHVSYALSQLSHAVSQPNFIRQLLSFHFHVILSPLVLTLSSFNDDQLAQQAIDLISQLCDAGGFDVSGRFVARIAESLSSGGLAWSRCQLYSLHCLGVLLSRHTDGYTCIKDKAALIYNLVMGLQVPSEEIKGEIMFVLYRLCLLLSSRKDEEGADVLLKYSPVLLYLSLDTLMKAQRDDVRLNCIALLKALGERGFLSDAFSSEFNMLDSCEANTDVQTKAGETSDNSLTRLFAEAIKSPLLSADTQVQVAALEFVFHCLSRGDCSGKQIEVLVEENLADYVFEILRLSEQKDRVFSLCLQVLDLLSTAEHSFKHRLAIGFTTLVSVLPLVAEVPLHPLQPQMLKLVLNGISTFPGVVSVKLVEEISNTLAQMLKRHTVGMGMLSETFIAVCSIFVALAKSPSSGGASALMPVLQEASRHAVLASLSIYDREPNQLLHSLYLLKEAYAFGHESSCFDSGIDIQLKHSVLQVCQKHLLPWFVTAVNEMEEESILGVLEILHLILSHGHDNQVLELTQSVLSLSWFQLSFRCLGMYPTERMKLRVYVLLGSIVDNFLGDDSGQSITAAASSLPADPVDLLFLLGQKGTKRSELSSCQTAVLQILYVSSFYDETLADKQLVLASVEQYILANSSHLCCGAENLIITAPLLNLYGLYRGCAELSYQICYSPEAEKIFFQLVTEQDWDLSSFDIHLSSLKWLFQQERISTSLSSQILKLCKKWCSNGTQMNCQTPNFQYIAQLTATGDNLLPKVMISLLEHLAGEEMVTDDLVSLFHFISSIIHNFPDASDQLHLHGIGNAVQILCSNLLSSLSLENRVIISRFIFIILSSARAQTLNDDEAWLAIIMKLLDAFTSTMTANGLTEEHLLVVGVLSLVLHHSTQGALIEASRFICLSSSLASLIQASIDELSTTGSTSSELNEGTNTEQALVLLLLFYHFNLRSLQVVLPGTIDWPNFLKQPEGTCTYPSIGILCQDLCKLLHWGSPLIKLVASYCLLELLTGLSDPRRRQQSNLRCPVAHLRSMVAVLEGMVFDTDRRISMNSCLCLSMILGWETPGVHHTSLVRRNGWCRMIMEELAVSLAAPCPVSKSLMNHHRPAVHIARALLKSKITPPWMKSVFDEVRVSGIIENLSPNNVSAEVILLCQELLQSAFLKPAQIATLKQILQACRHRVCMESSEDESMGDQTRKLIAISGDLVEVCEFLLELMLSESHPDIDSGGPHITNPRLAEEIDLFFRLLVENENLTH